MTCEAPKRIMTLERNGDELSIGFRYDPAMVGELKMIPGARWNPETKSWVVPLAVLKHIVRLAVEHSYTPIEAAKPTWAMNTLLAIEPEHRAGVYKAVAKVLHPDHGGDLAAMKAWTAAWTDLTNPPKRKS